MIRFAAETGWWPRNHHRFPAHFIRAALVLLALVCAPRTGVSAEPEGDLRPLTLDEAVRAGLDADDPSILRFAERASARDEEAVADAQLPDPKLALRFQNFPVDSFRLGDTPMTQIQIALQQAFPRGRTLHYSRARREAEAAAERARMALARRQLVLAIRQAWLDLYYWSHARRFVAESRQAVAELETVASGSFAAGKGSSEDVLRARFELAVLDDRLVEIDRRIARARADLARWIGPERAARRMPGNLPVLPTPSPIEGIRAALLGHPSVLVADALIEMREAEIAIARQQYKPAFTAEVGYGVRGGGQTDFASAGVIMDLPIFTGRRQDRRLAAAKAQSSAARLDRDLLLKELNQRLDRAAADWERLNERAKLYREVVTVRAGDTTEAALNSYRSAVIDFAELIRARLAELDAEITALKLEVERARTQAELLFLEGDS
ncbi:MAG: heavy metal RND transporter [Rhodothalassiaceae bacterium]|nr:MAG: heavy metal RND transporter [Rhodothalassiaceae bacterium]